LFSYGRCRLARAASRLTVPPTPSHGPLPRDVAERFHSAGESTFLAKRFESTRTIAGTHRLHSFRPISADKLEVRDFSANEDKRIECVFANSNTTCDNVNITANTGYITAVYDRAWRLAYVTKAIPDSGKVEVSFLELRGPSRSFKYPTRVATRPGLPGTSRNRALLSRVPGGPVPGRQMSRNPPLTKYC
jgi:hypothetical protein